MDFNTKKKLIENMVRAKFVCKTMYIKEDVNQIYNQLKPLSAELTIDEIDSIINDLSSSNNPKEDVMSQEDIDSLLNSIVSHTNNDDVAVGEDPMPEDPKNDIQVGKGVDSPNKDEQKAKSLDELKNKLDKTSNFSTTADKQIEDSTKQLIIKYAEANKELSDINAITNEIAQLNDNFKKAPQDRKQKELSRIYNIVTQTLNSVKQELNSVKASNATFEKKKYKSSNILKEQPNAQTQPTQQKTSNKKDEIKKLLQNVSKEDALKALQMLKKDVEKKQDTKPSEDSQNTSDGEKEADDEFNFKEPEPFDSSRVSKLADSQTLKNVGTIFKFSVGVVAYLLSNGNDNVRNFIKGINGGLENSIKKLSNLAKQGNIDAKELNTKLKDTYQQMQANEYQINKTLQSLITKTNKSEDEVKKMIEKNRGKYNIGKARQELSTNNPLDKLGNEKPKDIDPGFMSYLKSKIPQFESYLKSTDKKHRETLVSNIYQLLMGSGSKQYPALSTLYKSDSDRKKAINSDLNALAKNQAPSIQLNAEQVQSIQNASKGGEMYTYFLSEEALNKALTELARMIVNVKQLNIEELKKKTGLKASTINNWINNMKKSKFDQDIVKAIGNQKAQ